MDKCEILQGLLDGYIAEGNAEAAAGIIQAMEASGCTPQTEGGSTGDGPPGGGG